MAAIKSYTDIEQSRKLAEILPLESSDMIWDLTNLDLPTIRAIPYEDSDYSNKYLNIIPSWSLAALFNVLSNTKLCNYNSYFCQYMGIGDEFPMYSTQEYNNSVDACVEMIEKLHEQKLL